MAAEPNFAEIREKTNGYLTTAVYQAIYEAAKAAPPGAAVDVGAAQGAATIALGLGRRAGGRLQQIYAIDAFRGSKALKSKTDVNANRDVLRSNLAEHGLDGATRILTSSPTVGQEMPADTQIAILVVDADGALDRDFTMFYDRLVPGAVVILDDFELKYDYKYMEYTPEKMKSYLASKGVESLKDVNPLGAHFTVFRFANYFVNGGLLLQDSVVKNTGFFRKPQSAIRFNTASRMADLAEIRADIERLYWTRRKARAAGNPA